MAKKMVNTSETRNSADEIRKKIAVQEKKIAMAQKAGLIKEPAKP